MGSLHFASKEITAVNNFHRALLGEPDYYTASDNNCAVVNRTNGAVVVAGYGSNLAVGESTILKLIADGGSVQKFVYTRVAPTSVNIKLRDGDRRHLHHPSGHVKWRHRAGNPCRRLKPFFKKAVPECLNSGTAF